MSHRNVHIRCVWCWGVWELIEWFRFKNICMAHSKWIWHLNRIFADSTQNCRSQLTSECTCGMSRIKKKLLQAVSGVDWSADVKRNINFVCVLREKWFRWCINLVSINYYQGNQSYRKWDHISLSEKRTNLIFFQFTNEINFPFACSLCRVREWKEKFDLVDDEEKDQLTYHYRNKFVFRPDLSGPGLTGNEIVTMIHPRMSKKFRIFVRSQCHWCSFRLSTCHSNRWHASVN